MAVIERKDALRSPAARPTVEDMDVLTTIEGLQKAFPSTRRTLDFVRGLKVFDGPNLYIVKPDAYRYWTQSSALNDADEIAGTLLTYPGHARS